MSTTYSNYQTTYTSNNANAEGGGFFTGGTQGGGGASQGGQGRSKYDEETLRPVTIKQLHDTTLIAQDSNQWSLDGEDLQQVTFVGQVRQLLQQPTHITYTVDDGTAVMDVKRWLDSDKTANLDENVAGGGNTGGQKAVRTSEYEKPVVEDGFIRVWGRIKSFDNKKHIGAHMVKPIEDFNEVNYHLLEATYVHLLLTRAKQQGGGSDSMFVDNESFGGNAAVGSYGGHGQGGGGGDGHDDFSQKIASLSPGARKVCHFLRAQAGTNEGMHLNAIAQGTGLSIRDVLHATDECVAGGQAYTTVDDEHWALLEY